MKTHLAYVYKNLLQTYHNAGFFWLLKNQNNYYGGAAFPLCFRDFPQTTSQTSTFFINVY